MKAARIHRFGAPDVVVVEEVPRPAPAAGELLIRVAASGVGPWDALIREGKSKVSPPPPLTLGSDLSGVVEEAGPSVSEFKKGDEIYGHQPAVLRGKRTICCRPCQHGGPEAFPLKPCGSSVSSRDCGHRLADAL